MFLTSGLTITGGLTIGTPSDSTSPRNALLLSGNYGVNNGTNNTFLDSSSYAQTVTRNGDATQGSFTPYDFNYSVFFNGSSDFLQLPSNTAFVLGTGNFTIECWVYFNSLSTTQHIIDMRGGAAAAVGVAIYMTSSTIRFYTANADRITSSSISAGTWYHVAVVRNFGTTTMYLNGTATGSTYADTNSYIINGPFIGRFSGSAADFMNGYISNLRITRGQALYTATFTPPTATLTTTSQAATASNVAALVCQSNRFMDNSPNNFTVTVNSAPRIAAFSPFVLPYSYNPDAVNRFYVGSGYFDGTGDQLSVAYSTLLNPSSGVDFTIECWAYCTARTDSHNVVSMNSTTLSNWRIIDDSGSWVCTLGSATVTGSTVRLHTWTHLAMVQSSNNLLFFVNGVQQGSTTAITSWNTNSIPLTVSGRNGGDRIFTGYIANVRVIRGTAVYTTAFTPPTLPLSTVNNTVLLLNFTNSNIPDYTMNNNLVTVGDAKLSSTVTKYNPYSIAFDGTGDYCQFRMTDVNKFGSMDFTIEGWIYRNNSSDGGFYTDRATSPDYSGLSITIRTNQIAILASVNGSTWGINTVATPTGNTVSVTAWAHIAITRSGSTWYVFINGVLSYSQTLAGTLVQSQNTAYIGADIPDSKYLNGYIDDLRITKGLARYTANFTPPQGPLPLA
jgi:hypothetical protein